MPSMVAIDIETTGLDPARDAILEIAAVRFNGHRVEDEWSTLVNPGKPVPAFITQLTGITNEMVRNAPRLEDVLQDFTDFVGDDTVIAHSVRFDLSFLQRHKILRNNNAIDTYEMAAIVLPTNPRYNLDTLARQCCGESQDIHRGLHDAELTRKVFLHLYKEILELPIEILAEIVRYSEGIEWDGSLIFQQALREKGRMPIEAKKARQEDYGDLFGAGVSLPPLIPVETPSPLDADEIAANIEHGGPFAHYFENFESRPSKLKCCAQSPMRFPKAST